MPTAFRIYVFFWGGGTFLRGLTSVQEKPSPRRIGLLTYTKVLRTTAVERIFLHWNITGAHIAFSWREKFLKNYTRCLIFVSGRQIGVHFVFSFLKENISPGKFEIGTSQTCFIFLGKRAYILENRWRFHGFLHYGFPVTSPNVRLLFLTTDIIAQQSQIASVYFPQNRSMSRPTTKFTEKLVFRIDQYKKTFLEIL